MPTYKITDPSTGRTFKLTGDTPPTEQDIDDVLSQMGGAKQEPVEKKSLLSKVGEGIGRGAGAVVGGVKDFATDAIEHPGETAKGLFMGAAETGRQAVRYPAEGLAQGVGFLARKMDLPGAKSSEEISQGFESDKTKMAEERQQTPTTARAAKVGEFGSKMAVGGMLGSAVPVIGGSKVLQTVAQGSASNLPFVPKAFEEGGTEGALKDVAIDAGINTLMLGAGQLLKPARKAINKAIGETLQTAGKKIQMSTIKPSIKDVKDGFDVKNVFKYGFEGGLEDALPKIDTKFNELGSQLNKKLTESPAEVDLTEAFFSAVDEISKTKDKSFGSNTQIDNAVNYLLGEIENLSEDGLVNLKRANDIKRGVGRIGAWEFGKFDPESSARELVANTFYTKLKESIEKAAPEGIAEINKQLSEIIPIESAIIRRIPVKQRNDMIGLTDIVAGAGAMASGPKGWALAILNRLSKSPTIGAGMYRTGEKIAEEGITLPLAKKTIKNPISRAGVGAGIGATTDKEDRLRGAAIGAGSGFLLSPKNIRRVTK